MRRILFFCVLLGLVCLPAAVLYAQSKEKGPQGKPTDRVDLKTQTLVGKKLDRVEERDGKTFHVYKYRVVASPTEKEMPRYTVSPSFNVSYTQEGFQKDDSVTLISANEESATDSNIWVYEASFAGAGVRSLTFETSGSVMAPMFAVADNENYPPDWHCILCQHATFADCLAYNCQLSLLCRRSNEL